MLKNPLKEDNPRSKSRVLLCVSIIGLNKYPTTKEHLSSTEVGGEVGEGEREGKGEGEGEGKGEGEGEG